MAYTYTGGTGLGECLCWPIAYCLVCLIEFLCIKPFMPKERGDDEDYDFIHTRDTCCCCKLAPKDITNKLVDFEFEPSTNSWKYNGSCKNVPAMTPDADFWIADDSFHLKEKHRLTGETRLLPNGRCPRQCGGCGGPWSWVSNPEEKPCPQCKRVVAAYESIAEHNPCDGEKAVDGKWWACKVCYDWTWPSQYKVEDGGKVSLLPKDEHGKPITGEEEEDQSLDAIIMRSREFGAREIAEMQAQEEHLSHASDLHSQC